ncbi:epoxide hydrolase N-terminal domain-containing protein [Actinomadura sp. NPDC023710]|uniref:epoxide hydrolase family protein n=1 Tax=Actinomadura sp. NPDC023710 TaxID=3158219 RepID=UPI003404E95F
MTPLVIAVPDADLDDLRSRLRRTRWPDLWPAPGWSAGTDPAALRRLTAYWADGYDWRTHEAAHGGDLGAGISARLAEAHPEALVGIHVLAVDVPTALALFPADLAHPPRTWAERTYNLTRYTVMPRGGHFAAHEEPVLLADDLKDFFRPLR